MAEPGAVTRSNLAGHKILIIHRLTVSTAVVWIYHKLFFLPLEKILHGLAVFGQNDLRMRGATAGGRVGQ